MYQGSSKYRFNQSDIDPSISTNIASGAGKGAAAGSMAGPWGAAIGTGLGLGMSIWDEMERRKQVAPMTQSALADRLGSIVGRRGPDDAIQARGIASLAPVGIAGKTFAGAMGGYEQGAKYDDLMFKRKLVQDNPWLLKG
jgi:hypothetical protein